MAEPLFDPSEQIRQIGREQAQGISSAFQSLNEIMGARLQAEVAQEKYKLSVYDDMLSEIDAKTDELSEIAKNYSYEVIKQKKETLVDQIRQQIKEGGDITRESIAGLERAAQEIGRSVAISNSIAASYKQQGEAITELMKQGVVDPVSGRVTLTELEKTIEDPSTYTKSPEQVRRQMQGIVYDSVNVPMAAYKRHFENQETQKRTFELGDQRVTMEVPVGLWDSQANGGRGGLNANLLRRAVQDINKSLGRQVTPELERDQMLQLSRMFGSNISSTTDTARINAEQKAKEEGTAKQSEEAWYEDMTGGAVRARSKAMQQIAQDKNVSQVITARNAEELNRKVAALPVSEKEGEEYGFQDYMKNIKQSLGRGVGADEDIMVVIYNSGNIKAVDLKKGKEGLRSIVSDLDLPIFEYEKYTPEAPISPLPGVDLIGTENTTPEPSSTLEYFKKKQ